MPPARLRVLGRARGDSMNQCPLSRCCEKHVWWKDPTLFDTPQLPSASLESEIASIGGKQLAGQPYVPPVAAGLTSEHAQATDATGELAGVDVDSHV